MKQKYNSLKKIVKDTGSAVVAFSGGLDSSLLLKVAQDVLGSKVLAVTALSPTYPAWEAEDARRVAEEIGARHRTIHSCELDLPGFRDNPPERCYYCKKELFSQLRKIADEEGFESVLVGANVSDLSDYRPGHRAAEELGVKSPFLEADMTKEDIRSLARELGLSVWDKPALACLASRFPYGERITEEKLNTVAHAEQLLKKLGVRQYRVRVHGDSARIETDPESFECVMRNREMIVDHLKKEGFQFVALDLEGYRTGSMNATLPGTESSQQIPSLSKGEPDGADFQYGNSPQMEQFPSKVKVEKIEDVDLSAITGWRPQDVKQGEYVVYVDGCSKGNPGEAAYAFVAFAQGGVEVLRGGQALGRKTNNQAEYEGLIAALQASLANGLTRIQVLSDSELLVKQMQGSYKVKNPELQILWGQARSLSSRFEQFDVQFTRRGGNAAADKLANEALRIGLRARRTR